MMNKNLAISCVQRQIDALCSVQDQINTSEYKSLYTKMLSVIDGGNRIFICGVGKNANIATKISESMASLGVKSGYISPTNYIHGDAGYIEHDDMVLYITRSGKTAEILTMIDHINSSRKRDFIYQILVHSNKDLEYNKTDQYFIPGVVEGDELELAPTTSTTAFLCFLDSLTVLLSAELKFTRGDFLKFHPGGNLGKILSE